MAHQFNMLRLARDAAYKRGASIGCLRAVSAARGDLVECMMPSATKYYGTTAFSRMPCVFLELFERSEGGMMVRVAYEHGVIEIDALLVNRVLSKA